LKLPEKGETSDCYSLPDSSSGISTKTRKRESRAEQTHDRDAVILGSSDTE
jgi:hypothetical protein